MSKERMVQMKRFVNKEKGITLIALIITIIVMLILVTVTIRVATNGNLFTHAANAAKGTKTAIAGEEDILNDNLDKSIEDIVAEQTGNITYTAYTVGQTVTIGENEEEFYVIEDSDSSTSTVKLLAKYNVDTNTNTQSASAGTVVFDSTGTTNNYNYNDENIPTIKPLVNSYVSSLGVTVQEGRLMTLAEVEALGGDSANTTTSGCTGDSAFVNATNFWLGSPREGTSTDAWVVYGDSKLLKRPRRVHRYAKHPWASSSYSYLKI